MPEEQPPTRIIYAGRTEDERIASAQMFQIGIGILQRYSQAFTPDEKSFMNTALSMYARQVDANEGVKQQVQQVAPQPAAQNTQPPVQPVQHNPPKPKR